MLDEQLIKSVQSDNKYAFKTLFNLYEKKVFRTAYLILRDKHYAEDVVQDTFLQVYLKINNLTNVEAFEVWLYKITVNQCTNFIKKAKKVYTIEMDDQYENNIMYSQRRIYDVENDLIEKETKQKIINCLYALPMKYRTVLTLFYYNDMTISQISQIMMCTEGTIKSRLFYGKKKLKKILLTAGANIIEIREDVKYEVQ